MSVRLPVLHYNYDLMRKMAAENWGYSNSSENSPKFRTCFAFEAYFERNENSKSVTPFIITCNPHLKKNCHVGFIISIIYMGRLRTQRGYII